jgi:hypothetical protein
MEANLLGTVRDSLVFHLLAESSELIVENLGDIFRVLDIVENRANTPNREASSCTSKARTDAVRSFTRHQRDVATEARLLASVIETDTVDAAAAVVGISLTNEGVGVATAATFRAPWRKWRHIKVLLAHTIASGHARSTAKWSNRAAHRLV